MSWSSLRGGLDFTKSEYGVPLCLRSSSYFRGRIKSMSLVSMACMHIMFFMVERVYRQAVGVTGAFFAGVFYSSVLDIVYFGCVIKFTGEFLFASSQVYIQCVVSLLMKCGACFFDFNSLCVCFIVRGSSFWGLGSRDAMWNGLGSL